MRKNDRNRKKNEWSKAIEKAFRLLGYEGDVIIEDDPDDSRRWFIEHTAFGCCFDGYPPLMIHMPSLLSIIPSLISTECTRLAWNGWYLIRTSWFLCTMSSWKVLITREL